MKAIRGPYEWFCTAVLLAGAIHLAGIVLASLSCAVGYCGGN